MPSTSPLATSASTTTCRLRNLRGEDPERRQREGRDRQQVREMPRAWTPRPQQARCAPPPEPRTRQGAPPTPTPPAPRTAHLVEARMRRSTRSRRSTRMMRVWEAAAPRGERGGQHGCAKHQVRSRILANSDPSLSVTGSVSRRAAPSLGAVIMTSSSVPRHPKPRSLPYLRTQLPPPKVGPPHPGFLRPAPRS